MSMDPKQNTAFYALLKLARDLAAEYDMPNGTNRYTSQIDGLANLFSDVDDCGCCFSCVETKQVDGWPMLVVRFIACPECGNKRCPKATHHRNACTKSNAPGQPGSCYTGGQETP